MFANDSGGVDMFGKYHLALRQAILARISGSCAGAGFQGAWAAFGPDSLPDQAIGKLNAVWADPADSNYVLAGATGGLFKTADGGKNWYCITDNTILTGGVMGVGSICVNSRNKNTIYIGTGILEEQGAIDQTLINGQGYGAGILKSFDGGTHWQQEFIPTDTSFTDSLQMVHRVYISPDSLRLYAFLGNRVYTRSNGTTPGSWTDITPPSGVAWYNGSQICSSCPATKTASLSAIWGQSRAYLNRRRRYLAQATGRRSP